MAVLTSQTHEPFQDGLGKGSSLGVGFLRRIRIDFNASATTKAIAAADVGATKIYQVQSIVPLSVETFFVSAQSDASVTITASTNAGVCDVYLLVAGI